MTHSKTAVSFAAAAALIAISGASLSTPAFAKDAKLAHCYGVNSCKGTSDCKSGTHECKGQNDCKGQGFKAESKSQCKTDGGSLTAPK